jgi:hypothetical protein
MEQARRHVSRWIFGIALAVSAWVGVYPRPYAIAVLSAALVPVLAAWLAVRMDAGLVGDRGPQATKPGFGTAIAVPSSVLVLRAVADASVLDAPRLGVWVATITLILSAIGARWVWFRVPRWPNVVALVLFAGFWTGGVVVMANRLLDRSQPEVFTADVLAREISRGRGVDAHVLIVGPWGPAGSPQRLEVPRHLHAQTSPGARVCIHLRPGALRARWFDVRECPGAA